MNLAKPTACLTRVLLIIVLVLSLALVAGSAWSSRDRGGELRAGYELPYGSSPFAPSELRLQGAKVLAPGALAGSAACGACHPEIYRQWQSSLHRAGGLDPFARYAIDRMAEDWGVASTRLCEACHEPGAVLSGSIDRGVRVDEATRREGVSCLSCHLALESHPAAPVNAIANASLTFAAPPDYDFLFTPRHARALRRPYLATNEFCGGCHAFFVPTQLGGTPAGRLRLQHAEARGTVYDDPSAPGYKSCVECHMPLVEGVDPAAKEGLIHDHRSLGSNLLVPTLNGDVDQVRATLAFRQKGAVTLAVGELTRTPQAGLTLPVVLTNERNGHDFPSGATDISETWLELTLTDAGGREVYRSPGLDSDRFLSAEAPTLNSLVTDMWGGLDYQHDLFSQVELRRHVRVSPGGSVTLDVPVVLPAEAQAPLVARVVLRARHGNERWNRWVFNWAPVEVPVADVAVAERALPRLPADVPPPVPPAVVMPEPPGGMVAVPGGAYVVGADPRRDPDASLTEFPPHPVTLAPFFLDRIPVTNRAYAEAVNRGVVKAPEAVDEPPLDRHSWHGSQPPAGLDDHPVVLVTYREAQAYCESLGKRLPTEAEWEAAARGPDGRRFPWGDSFDPALCNTAESGLGHSVPAGSAPGNASPFGALDMGCNVAEWTADRLRAYPRVRLFDNRDEWNERYAGYYAATRGATYETLSWRARASHRGFEMGIASNYDDAIRKLIGFRCAADAARAP